MPELELFEIEEFVLMTIGLIAYFYNLKNNPKLRIWLPGILFLFMGFLFTNLEALILPELFNLLEHVCYLLASINMLLGAVYYYKNSRFLKNSKKELDKVN